MANNYKNIQEFKKFKPKIEIKKKKKRERERDLFGGE